MELSPSNVISTGNLNRSTWKHLLKYKFQIMLEEKIQGSAAGIWTRILLSTSVKIIHK